MGGDYGRMSFDALRDFAGVLIQQGHPILDSDWNEYVALVERRLRAQTVDTLGRAVVPRETPTGFQIALAAGPVLRIGRGRMYVDGLLAENHGRIGAGAAPVFDRARVEAGRAVGVLDEAISQATNDFVDYGAQPYLPVAPPLPQTPGPHVVYLDAWQREVTPLKDPRLLEPALGGIDTATRWQTVWQVRVLANAGAGTTCANTLPAWDALIAPSPARLTTATIEFEDPDDPCLIPPGGGYRGLENQLYRLEIHSGGPLGQARFKWSRDNASVGATVEAFHGADRLTIRRVGRDSVLRLRTGDWVEITDDRREFAGLSGDMRRVEVNEDTNELRLGVALSADLVPSGIGADTAAARHSRVIKWDQSGPVLRPDGTELVDLDDAASDGLIPVPANGGPVVLEAGITVTFSATPAGGALRGLDHWLFAARTETRAIDILTNAPPVGVHHHYARLAVVTFPATVLDCRVFWPPEFGAECGCTVCVSAEEHNSGVRTLQSAIDSLGEDGGTVCLSPGDFVLGEAAVLIDERRAVRLRGHGSETRLIYAGNGGALRVSNARDIRISDLGIAALNPRGGDARAATYGIHLRNVTGVRVEHCQIIVLARGTTFDTGVALDGLTLAVTLDDIAVFAPFGIHTVSGRAAPGTSAFCALMDLSIEACALLANRRGIALEGNVVHLGPTQLNSNLILADEAGISATGVGFPVDNDAADAGGAWSAATVTVRGNAIGFGAAGFGVISGVQDLQLLDNTLIAQGRGADQPGACILLAPGLFPPLLPDGQIIGNRLGNTAGTGIAIDTSQSALMIKRNVIRDCGLGGITTGADAGIETLSIADNVIERVGLRGRGEALAAIRISAVREARILDNRIAGVGSTQIAAPYYAGIDLRGAGALDLAHNTLSEIQATADRGVAVGILIDGAVAVGALSSNRIVGNQGGAAGSSWCAILIDGVDGGNTGGRLVAGGALPALFNRGDHLVAFAPALGALVLADNREGLLRLAGNQVIDDHERSALPLVLVRVGTRTGACTFAENQCTLLVQGVVPAIIALTAPRLVATGNVIRRLRNDQDALHLTCRVAGNTPATTVVGNITFGNIRVNGGSLPAAFQPLNILSQ